VYRCNAVDLTSGVERLLSIVGPFCRFTGLTAASATLARRHNCVVLLYHRVCPASDFSGFDDGYAITPECFRQQMQIVRRSYVPASLGDLLKACATGSMLASRSVHVTFDDGYRDIQRYVAPILSALSIPATVFALTGFAETTTNIWWDDLALAMRTARASQARVKTVVGEISIDIETMKARRDSFRQVKNRLASVAGPQQQESLAAIRRALQSDEPEPLGLFMDWNALREVDRAGVRVESHGVSHERFALLADDALAGEMSESKQQLERVLGREVLAVAYPYGTRGMYDARACRAAEAAGYRLAFSGRSGTLGEASPRFDLPRVPVRGSDGTALFQSKLSGAFGIAYGLGRRMANAIRAE
jgi:peptidoglycan/xylan/chitin deacetylase (PgdA/CDA1 family)